MKQTPGSHSSSVIVAVCVVDIRTVYYFLVIRPKVNIKKGIGPEPEQQKVAQEKLLKKSALSFQLQTAGIPAECSRSKASTFRKLHLN